MSCDDKECPGCLMLEAIKKINDQGLDMDDIIQLFFMSLQDTFADVRLEMDDGHITLYDKRGFH